MMNRKKFLNQTSTRIAGLIIFLDLRDPGEGIPLHKHLNEDELIFIAKK